MSPDAHPDENKAKVAADGERRKNLVQALGSAVPAAIIVWAMDGLKLRFISDPGQALWIIIPGLAFVSLFYVTSKTRQALRLRWPFLVVLSVYLLIFVVADYSRVLDWRRTLAGYEDTTPENFLALNRFGDWHYKFVREKPNEDLAVVLMERPPSVDPQDPQSPPSVEISRMRIAQIINYARCHGATGVALDIHFAETVGDSKELNKTLCHQIDPAKALQIDPTLVVNDLNDEGCKYSKEMPVFVGYDFEDGDKLTRARMDPALSECIPEARLGHAVGYLEWDNKMRSIPQHFYTYRLRKSLSLVVAEYLAGLSNQHLETPGNELLQFTKPAGDLDIINWSDVWNNYEKGDAKKILEDQNRFQDHFILVGADKDQDGHDTPYGFLPGVVIHAYAVHSIRQDRFIRRAGWWFSLLMIWVSCYLLMFFMSRGVGTLRLIAINVAFSVFIIALAILVMYFWRTWIDPAYPLLAIWGFLLLLPGLRRIGLTAPTIATDSPQSV